MAKTSKNIIMIESKIIQTGCGFVIIPMINERHTLKAIKTFNTQ